MTLLTAILGTVMVTSGLAARYIGLPKQIAENRRRGSAPHAMRWFAGLGTVAYASRSLWCLVHHDWVLGLSEASGALPAAVLLWQVMRYPDSG